MSTAVTHPIDQSIDSTMAAMAAFKADERQLGALRLMGEAMAETFKAGHTVMACGNGGSACQAMHFAEELTGRYRADRRALPALALTDASHLTCVGNDYGFEHVFSRAVEAYGRPGDGLLVLSTSGNSQNLIHAVRAAQAKQMVTYALLGKGGGELQGSAVHEVIAPGGTSDCVQNLHTVMIHTLIESVERALFPENYEGSC